MKVGPPFRFGVSAGAGGVEPWSEGLEQFGARSLAASARFGARTAVRGVVLPAFLAAGGATTVHRSSTLIDNDRLVSCCGDSVFCLELPSLNLLWTVRADLATCFQIFKSENNYIIHGELLVTSLDETGQINWQFGGADIFVSNGGHEAFIMDSDGIILTDFAGTKYRIDFIGQLLWRA